MGVNQTCRGQPNSVEIDPIGGQLVERIAATRGDIEIEEAISSPADAPTPIPSNTQDRHCSNHRTLLVA
jgi:hypothetical protein